jgi:hypothetical protein
MRAAALSKTLLHLPYFEMAAKFSDLAGFALIRI